MKSIKMMIVTTFVLASVVGFCSSVQAVENFELYNKSEGKKFWGVDFFTKLNNWKES